jgi:hypothetical protein
MGLCVCSGCNRHVKECTSVCPFCGAPFVAARVERTEPGARVAAAAIIGAAAVLSGCSSQTGVLYGAPGVPQDATFDVGPDAALRDGDLDAADAAIDAIEQDQGLDGPGGG